MKERRGELARSVAVTFAGVAVTAFAFSAAANLEPEAAFDDRANQADRRPIDLRVWEAGKLGHPGDVDARVGDDNDTRELDEARNSDGSGGAVNDDLDRPGLRRPRGITPPWREHAIPELRKNPDRKSKKFHA